VLRFTKPEIPISFPGFRLAALTAMLACRATGKKGWPSPDTADSLAEMDAADQCGP